jgi:modulator of FtsH protease HflC
MSARVVPLVVGLALLVLLGLTSVYTVSETEFAFTRSGAQLGASPSPGLHWKLPWDQVVKFDRRILAVTHPGESFTTRDGHALLVDYYVQWRVRDPLAYYEATGGSEDSASARIHDIIKQGMRQVLGAQTQQQVVMAERITTPQMLEETSRSVAELGVQLIDVRVQNLALPEEVAARVHETMKQSFLELASRRRAEGTSAATGLRAAADRQRTEIVADADREALTIKGEADGQAADIYARAYASNPEFYAFYRSLQAYERSLGKSGDVLVLSPDSEFFKYLKDPSHSSRH